MSPVFGRGQADHDRARELAAARLDEALAPADAAWLDEHLVGCPACASIAASYDADRAALRGLRDHAPEPPRDLWARTAAAIEAEGGARGGPVRPARRVFGIPTMTLAPLAGLAVVAIVVGAGLLNGQPTVPVGGAHPTPIAVTSGNVAVLSHGQNGALELQTGNLHEVCPITADECRVEPSFEVAQVAGIGSSDDVEAMISPSGDRLVVIQRNDTGTGGVFVVPVKTPVPSGSAATPTPAPTDAPTEVPIPSPTETVAPTETASETPSDAVSPSPSGDALPTAVPTESPSDATASPDASDGPSPTVEPTEAPTAAPTETPVVAVTPRPDGALEIASDVIVVDGPAGYSPDGLRFAFTARPADGSGGPDVYVWRTDDTVAHAITVDHRSVFAGWDRGDLLVSRVVDAQPNTVRIDPATGEQRGEPGRNAWLPTLSPDRSHAVWWDGTVRLARDGVTWLPDQGQLVVGPWPEQDGDVQALADDVVTWQARWDADGTALAVWLAGRGKDAGRLSLYAVDEAGRANLAKPMLEDAPALGAFTIEPGMLAWSAPGEQDKRTVQVLAWKGDTIGRAELPAEGDTTLVQ